jgi:hypothetical protein
MRPYLLANYIKEGISMAERKAISKKLRFEVFKRDSFTCQYCGHTAPDVVLQVDHIKPVAQGGKNELMNLVTACVECNQGKGARELNDSSVVKKQQRQLAELNERKEQLKLMLAWKEELALMVETQIDAIDNLLIDVYQRQLSAEGRRRIKEVIKRFSFNEVYDATEIAVSKYDYIGTAIDKIGGICYNRKHGIRGKSNGH